MTNRARERTVAPLKLGTRGSELARWQAGWVAEELAARGTNTEIVEVESAAEKFPEKHLDQLGVGVFTAALDDALLEGTIDFAVHSLKDVPSSLHAELELAAVPEREVPWDAFVSPPGERFDTLPKNARIGTSSPRRKAQLLDRRSDLEIVPLRGNVETRLRKVREQGLAGTVLACAGLLRLGKDDAIAHAFDLETLVPAVAQGALGIVARRGDEKVLQLLRTLDHEGSRVAVECERAYLRELRGGCQIPAGAYARVDGSEITLTSVLASEDGATCLRASGVGIVAKREELGIDVARELIARGGREILARTTRARPGD